MSILGVYFTFHMTGLVIWLGAALLLPITMIPAVRGLEGSAQIKFMEVFTKRYLPWFVMGVIAVGLTGWVQAVEMLDELNMSILSAKHFAILPLIAVSAYIWFILARKLSKPMADNKRTWTQFVILAWIQAGLSVIVLILVGWLTG